MMKLHKLILTSTLALNLLIAVPQGAQAGIAISSTISAQRIIIASSIATTFNLALSLFGIWSSHKGLETLKDLKDEITHPQPASNTTQNIPLIIQAGVLKGASIPLAFAAGEAFGKIGVLQAASSIVAIGALIASITSPTTIVFPALGMAAAITSAGSLWYSIPAHVTANDAYDLLQEIPAPLKIILGDYTKALEKCRQYAQYAEASASAAASYSVALGILWYLSSKAGVLNLHSTTGTELTTISTTETKIENGEG